MYLTFSLIGRVIASMSSRDVNTPFPSDGYGASILQCLALSVSSSLLQLAAPKRYTLSGDHPSLPVYPLQMIIDSLLEENRALIQALRTHANQATDRRAKYDKLSWEKYCDMRNLEHRCNKYQAHLDETKYEYKRMATVRIVHAGDRTAVRKGPCYTRDTFPWCLWGVSVWGQRLQQLDSTLLLRGRIIPK